MFCAHLNITCPRCVASPRQVSVDAYRLGAAPSLLGSGSSGGGDGDRARRRELLALAGANGYFMLRELSNAAAMLRRGLAVAPKDLLDLLTVAVVFSVLHLATASPGSDRFLVAAACASGLCW